MPRHLISVVIPVFNSASTLAKTLIAIEAQTRRPDEVVIVDDGSSDNLSEVLSTHGGNLPIKLISNAKNKGIGFSLRTGVENCIGDLVFRVDADDYWNPDHIALSERIFENDLNVVLCNSSARLIDSAGNELGLHQAVGGWMTKKSLISDNPFIHSSVSFKKSSYLKVGGYPQNVRWEDYMLWIDLAYIGAVASIPAVTVNYLVSTSSLSRVNKRMALKDRWVCQKKAIKLFGIRYPLTSLCAFLSFYLKMTVMSFSK